MILIDTSGIFGLIDSTDTAHDLVQHVLRNIRSERQVLLITDHVISETCTLLNARGRRHLVGKLYDIVHGASQLICEWTDAEMFREAEEFFMRHTDKGYSFTDCLSFIVMRRRGITDALTTDRHFTQAGFRALLAAR